MDHPPARRRLLIAAGCALAAACSRKPVEPTPLAATSQPAAEFRDSVAGGVGAPVNGSATPANVQAPGGPPTASGAFGGAATDATQTAAVTPLGNTNGTLPASPGVGPAGGVAAGGSASGPGVAAPTATAANNTARAAGAAGVTAAGRVAAPVTPVGGALGPSGVSGSPAPTAAAASPAPTSSVGVAASSGRAAPTVAAGSVSSSAPR